MGEGRVVGSGVRQGGRMDEASWGSLSRVEVLMSKVFTPWVTLIDDGDGEEARLDSQDGRSRGNGLRGGCCLVSVSAEDRRSTCGVSAKDSEEAETADSSKIVLRF